MRMDLPAAVLVTALVLAGCGGGPGGVTGGTEPPTTSTTEGAMNLEPVPEGPATRPLESTTPPSAGVDDRLAPLVAVAVADLAGRLGVEPASVTVVEARTVTWPDGSLGCPRPDMEYPQVQVDGALIVLEAAGATYEYHSGGARAPFLCEKA